jgi:capsular exopolysaccharide synthesis family protein
VFIVDKAEVPGGPSSPNLSRALLLSFALGLGAGLAAAYLLEQFDDTIRSAEEIERITGLATLGIIPKIAGAGAIEAELADPRSALAESYRSLCTALQFTTESGLPKSLVITSSGPSEGKSITSLAVARHFATMGLKVLLVDADLRNPSLHEKLGCDNGIGVSNYLTGACTPPEAFQVTEIPNLAFMASGPLPPNAADLLGNPRLLSLLSVGLEVFDLIVIDGPPVMGLADAALLSNAAAATVFVVGAGQARHSQVRSALKRLQFGCAALIGTVLTKFDAKAAGYGYGYGYGYGEGYGYGRGGEASQRTPVASDRPPQQLSHETG